MVIQKFGPMKAHKLQMAITFNLELSFEKNYYRWKDLNKKKIISPSKRGFEELMKI
jgi:hypothetical protein